MADIFKFKGLMKRSTEKDERKQKLKRSQEAILNKKTPFIVQEAYRTARTNIIFRLQTARTNVRL